MPSIPKEIAREAQEIALVNIPSPPLNRFLVLPSPDYNPDGFHVIFIDSVIRDNLSAWLGQEVVTGYSFKLSRDAELYIDNEFDGDLLHNIERSLEERDLGLPTRFLYDSNMPAWMRKRLKSALDLSKYDMIPGARYHNFNDFFGFPRPDHRGDLVYREMTPLPHPRLERAESVMGVMAASDVLLSFPYQKYDYVPQLIREAADDPRVTKIQITLYRVAKKSSVVKALLYALEQGKQVDAFVEAKARFDEASNLFWGKEMEDAGAYVRYSYPAVKVHTKLLHILREEDGRTSHYSYIGTGNFNEKTSKLYTDHALLTCRPVLGEDVGRVFDLLRGKLILPNCKELLVAPFNMQPEFEAMIQTEIANARAGKSAYLFLKMNSLEEPVMIRLLKKAAAAGVECRLIVRGICRWEPSEKEKNVEIISIIDRFLEHARIFIFGNGGRERVFIGSADWMNRNLFRRVEVVTPIDDPALKRELRRVMDMQWRDNQRSRIIAAKGRNVYRTGEKDHTYRAQYDIYEYFAGQYAEVVG